jgi:hypothetical protein
MIGLVTTMSQYKNVEVILEGLENKDQEGLLYLIENSDPTVLADTITYMLVTLLSSINAHERRRLKNKLMTEAANYEFNDLQGELEIE